MKCAIILGEFQRFDVGTNAILLGKPKFVTFDDEINNKAILMVKESMKFDNLIYPSIQ